MWYATLLSFGHMLICSSRPRRRLCAGKLDAFVVASAARRTSTRRRSRRRRRPISISIRRSACWRRSWWRRSPGRRCNGRPTAPSKTARSRVPARSRTRLIIILGSLIATGVLLAMLALRPRARRRDRLPIRRRCGLLGRLGARQVQRRLSLAEHRGQRDRGQPDRDRAHRARLHPQRVPDRQQLLHRHDPRDGGHVARPPAAGMGEPGVATGCTRR